LGEREQAGVDAAAALQALLATGLDPEADLPDVLRMLTGGLRPEAWVSAREALADCIGGLLTPLLDSSGLQGQPKGYHRRVPGLLDRIAELDPDLAQATLMAWGRGLAVPGTLDLSGRAWVTAIPEGLSCGWWLVLDGCRNLKTLPAGPSGQECPLPARMRGPGGAA
jgi:hypothetical protein